MAYYATLYELVKVRIVWTAEDFVNVLELFQPSRNFLNRINSYWKILCWIKASTLSRLAQLWAGQGANNHPFVHNERIEPDVPDALGSQEIRYNTCVPSQKDLVHTSI